MTQTWAVDAVKYLERLKPDQFELYFERKARTKIDSKDLKVDSVNLAEDAGLAIRLLKNQKMGFSYTTSLTPEAIKRAAQSAWDVAGHMPEDPYNSLFDFGTVVYPHLDLTDATLTGGSKVTFEQKAEAAVLLEQKTRGSDPRIKGIRSASITESQYEVQMLDSHGEQIHYQSSLYSASVVCKAEANGEAQAGSDAQYSRIFSQLNIQEVATQAALRATELLGSSAAPTLKCPAVFRNSVVADLLGFLSDSFSAESLSKGKSLLAGKMGTQVFSKNITLIDDPLLSGGVASQPFDAEGVPCGALTLIDGGLASGTLCDIYYAKKLGVKPTGSSHRSVSSPPSLGTSNLILKTSSPQPVESLLKRAGNGILITNLMGIHTANSVTGDFSLGATGILIENGVLTRPVRGFAVAGNILKLLNQVLGVGSDLRAFGSIFAPSILVSEVSVGGGSG